MIKSGNIIEKFEGSVFGEKTGPEAFNELYANDVMLQVPWLYLYKKEFINENEFTYPEGMVHEDFARTILMILKAKRVCSTNVYGYYYVQTDKSITRGNNDECSFQKSMDIIRHYDYIYSKVNSYGLDTKTTENVRAYCANNVILEADNLSGMYRSKYINELRKRKVYRCIKVKNLKQLIKRIVLRMSINLYLKMR